MASKSLSVLKRTRQNEKRRLRNRKRKQELRQAVKGIRSVGSKEEAQNQLPGVQSVIDKSARSHIVHRNAARRLKSRLAKEIAEKE